jgi:hypothetical protein
VIYDRFHGLCFQLRCGALKYDTDGVGATLKSSDSSGFNSLFRRGEVVLFVEDDTEQVFEDFVVCFVSEGVASGLSA